MAFKIKKILTYFKRIVVIIIVLNNLPLVQTQNTSLNNEIILSETSHKNSSTDNIPNLNNILRINSEKTPDRVEDGNVLSIPKIKTNESDNLKTADEDKISVQVVAANQNGSLGDDPVLSQLSSFGDVGEMDRGSWTKLSWLMELFDHHKWEKKHFDNVSRNCSGDMVVYINALRSGETWAAKSEYFLTSYFLSLLYKVSGDINDNLRPVIPELNRSKIRGYCKWHFDFR